jgi:hypothetical protein
MEVTAEQLYKAVRKELKRQCAYYGPEKLEEARDRKYYIFIDGELDLKAVAKNINNINLK